jgi:hypothetical protein
MFAVFWWSMHEIEVDKVDVKSLHTGCKSVDGSVVSECIPTPQLGGDEYLLTPEFACSHSSANRSLVLIYGCGIEMPVAIFQCPLAGIATLVIFLHQENPEP